MFSLPTLTLYPSDRVRLRMRNGNDCVPAGDNLYIVKIEPAPDGNIKIVWLSTDPPTREELTQLK
jgi:hypothetical protein